MSLYTYGQKWGIVAANLMRKLWASATVPSSPGEGEVYLDLSGATPELKRYNGASWDTIGASADLSAAWPIGSVFLSVVSTSPATLLGFGTWSRIAEGQFLVGLNSADTDFDAAEETGGEKTHKHKVDPPNTTSGNPSITNINEGSGSAIIPGRYHTHDVNIAEFDSGSASSLPPYCVVYAWKRTA